MKPETIKKVKYLVDLTGDNCLAQFTYAQGAWACTIICPGAGVRMVGQHPDTDSAFEAAVKEWWPKFQKRNSHLRDREPFDFFIP